MMAVDYEWLSDVSYYYSMAISQSSDISLSDGRLKYILNVQWTFAYWSALNFIFWAPATYVYVSMVLLRKFSYCIF